MTDAVLGGLGQTSLAGLLEFSRPDITVRAATDTDTAFCRALFHEDRTPAFSALNLDGRMLTMLLDQQFHAQQSGYRQTFPAVDDAIIEQAGAAIGRLMTAFPDSRTLHVIDILLSASVRRRGIGTDVMNSLAQVARAQGAMRLTLSVLRSNDGARRLYERLGFSATDDDGARVTMVKPLA